MNEFTTIKEYPNYEINSYGIIRNIKTKRIIKPKLHKTRGYLKVNLYKDKKSYTIDVHRLVGITLISNPNKLKYLDHIDRNRTNNNIINLRWCTVDDNLTNRNSSGLSLIYSDVINQFIVIHSPKKINISFNELNDAITFFKTFL